MTGKIIKTSFLFRWNGNCVSKYMYICRSRMYIYIDLEMVRNEIEGYKFENVMIEFPLPFHSFY